MNTNKQKFEELALKNLIDPAFNEYLQISKAFSNYSCSALTEDSYRAQIALFNGLLKHLLDTSFTKYFDAVKIETYLLHFEKLIVNSDVLNKTKSLEILQRQAKCLLYYRIGDYLITYYKFIKNKNNLDAQTKQIVYSFCAYALALDHILENFNKNNSFDSLIAIELYLLIKANLKQNIITAEEISNELKNPKLVSYFFKNNNFNVMQRFASPLSLYIKNAKNEKKETLFVANDLKTQAQKNWSLPKIDIENLLKNACNLLFSSSHYLRRLVWIMNYLPKFEKKILTFTAFNKLKEKPQSENEPCFPENLTQQDVMDFLCEEKNYCNSWISEDLYNTKDCNNMQNIAYPWILILKPTGKECIIWDGMLSIAYNKKLELSAKIRLSNTIERLRNLHTNEEINVSIDDISNQTESPKILDSEKLIKKETIEKNNTNEIKDLTNKETSDASIMTIIDNLQLLELEKEFLSKKKLENQLESYQKKINQYETDLNEKKKKVLRILKHNELLCKFLQVNSIFPVINVANNISQLEQPKINENVNIKNSFTTLTNQLPVQNLTKDEKFSIPNLLIIGKFIEEKCPREKTVDCLIQFSNNEKKITVTNQQSKQNKEYLLNYNEFRYQQISNISIRFLNLKSFTQNENKNFITPFYLTCENYQRANDIINWMNKVGLKCQSGY